MKRLTFADVVVPSLSFSSDHPAYSVLTALIDSRWVQRLREVHQTANTRLVYMFSEHSRFGHSLGVCYLADLTVRTLLADGTLPRERREEVLHYWPRLTLAALLHDIGHLAPGSHIAFRTWFPDEPDSHEEIGERILLEPDGIRAEVLELSDEYVNDIAAILRCDEHIPPWVWEILSGGGWNVDRGNWCVADSVMAGVSYGRYNINAIIDSLTIDSSGHVALRENRLDAMLHFAVSRHAMYRQLYQHRVLLAADALTGAVVRCARSLSSADRFADEDMECVLGATSASVLPLPTVFAMRESWWRYHLSRWERSPDTTLADLAGRLLHRKLLKTIRMPDSEQERAVLVANVREECSHQGYEPDYYCHHIGTRSPAESAKRGMMHVLRDDGSTVLLSDSDPLFLALGDAPEKMWLAVPGEVKARL